MGIPSYFSYIIKNYSNIIRNYHFLLKNGITFQHLYMDCNSIIYDAFRSIDLQLYSTIPELEEQIVEMVIQNIQKYIELIKPTKTVFIAFDGVAPFAKMEQQRNRRYKNSHTPLSNTATEKSTIGCEWSTSNITPGTNFMQLLSTRVSRYFEYSEKRFNVERMIVSTSNECGEGEHKMFHYIRSQSIDPTDTAAVYGLDSDLIMLSIFHCRLFKNLYIFREAPEFIKSSIPIVETPSDKAQNMPYFMDISLLSTSILSEMQCGHPDKQRIYDYVFLCFFLGNDFLPHFPSLNIRTNGIQSLLEMYRKTVGNHVDRFFISKDTGKIQWRWVSLFIGELAKCEHDFLISEYSLREKWNKRTWLVGTPEEQDQTLQSIPVIYRAEEKYICPQERHWEERYYRALFHCDYTDETRKMVSMNYLEGLEWVFKYYTVDCPHWQWKYNYHYPPLLKDLYTFIPHFDMTFIDSSDKNNRPFSSNTQLAYDLPKSHHYLLNKQVSQVLATRFTHLYPDRFNFQWAFCRYFWEAHACLPVISLELLRRWDTTFVI